MSLESSHTDPLAPVYKGYYMITSRCNLDCDYCVLENSPDQLRRELDLTAKKALIEHLYTNLRFRRLTISGGEALLIGKRAPADFLELMRFLRGFRSDDPRRDLRVELYTNGTLLDDSVADELVGVVDRVSITFDSNDERILSRIGRSTRRRPDYLQLAADVCGRLTRRGIQVKAHSVIGMLNHAQLGHEVAAIAQAVERTGGQIDKWKFYQYMSYDDPERDARHSIADAAFESTADRIRFALGSSGIALHFKGNLEMNDSLFNILPYGNAQYMRPGDTWTTTRRTRDLREYASMAALLTAHDIPEATFRSYHEV